MMHGQPNIKIYRFCLDPRTNSIFFLI